MKLIYKLLLFSGLIFGFQANSIAQVTHLSPTQDRPDYVSDRDIELLTNFNEKKARKELIKMGITLESEIQAGLYNMKKEQVLINRGLWRKDGMVHPHPHPDTTGGPCENAGFEMLNWTNWKGAVGYTNLPNNWTDSIGDAGNNAAVGNQQAQHTLMTSAGFDPNARDSVTGAYAIPLIPPGGGAVAVRLGNSYWQRGMERLRYKVLVSPQNTSFTYKYAIVMQSPTGHTAANQPAFEISVYDKNNNIVPGPCGFYAVEGLAAATDTAFRPYYTSSSYPVPSGATPRGFYKTWTTVSIDLSPYLNDSVTIEFVNKDCNLGAHYGYSYIDAQCSNVNQTYSVCPNEPSMQVVAPVGFNNYQWYDTNNNPIPAPNGTNDTLTINNPQPGQTYTVQMSSVSGCGSTAQVDLIANVVNATLSKTDIHCIGDSTGIASVTASGPAGPYNYTWVDSATSNVVDTNQTFSNAPAGTYYVTSTSSGGCSRTDTISLAGLYPTDTSSIYPVICQNSSFTLPGGSVVSTAGTYLDTLSNFRGCDSVVTTNLTVNNVLTSSMNPVVCQGTVYTLPGGGTSSVSGTFIDTLSSTVSGCDSIVTTNLTVNPVYSNSTNVTICYDTIYTLPGGSSVNTTGTYIDTLQTIRGCDSVITTNLTVTQPLTATQGFTICYDQTFTLPGGNVVNTTGTYIDTLTSINTGCDSIVTTNLTVTPPILVSENVTLACNGQTHTLPGGTVVSNGGTYQDTLTAVSTGCDSIITTTVTKNLDPIASFTATPTQGKPPLTVIFNNTSQNANTYQWSFGDGATSTQTHPTHIYSTPGTYNVVLVASVNGLCPDTARITIVVLENFGVLVPNIFTPNNDGKNDNFKPNVEGAKAIHAEIYDRWGLKMYEWNEIGGSWDGYTSAGLPATDGTYYYIIKLTELSGKTHYLKGPFTLTR